MADRVGIAATVAARGLDLRLGIAAGETVAVVGPNGAGKSSLIQLIAGSLAPDTGSVALDGVELSSPSRLVPIHRRRIGHLEQRALLFPHLSVLDNVAFGPRSRGATRATARTRAREELAAVGMAGFANRRPRELSGGQQQRVALARALAIDPEAVLLDEPFSALDAAGTPELRRLLRERLRGMTTVLVTHDFLDVASLADRVVELDEGRVVAEGTVDDVCQRPATGFMAGFVGLNLLRGEAKDASIWLTPEVAVSGLTDGSVTDGPARAVFAPAAVGIYRELPHGSPRNALPASVVGVEDRGLVQRVSLDVAGQRIVADLTPGAVRELDLRPRDSVLAVVKATQVSLLAG